MKTASDYLVLVPMLGALMSACSAAGGGVDNNAAGAGGAASGGAAGGGGTAGTAGSSPVGGASGSSGSAGAAGGVIPDPTTCAEAAEGHTYVGCEFWPTVTDNIVRPIFDFAAVVANTGSVDAHVVVSRSNGATLDVTVPAGGLKKIFLPWVAALKSLSWMDGSPDNGCPTWVKTSTVEAKGGAYKLVSDIPVAVYQFNAIEYAGQGGIEGKSWASCNTNNCFGQQDCFSYTNDASLLLPSTAMTGTYRIAGYPAWDSSTPDASGFIYPAYFAVTGTVDGTTVKVRLSSTAAIAGGGTIPSTPNGGTTSFGVNAGDVVMVVGTETSDFSGTLIEATAPVQVITGISCTQIPDGTEACDHIEESVLPAETLGKDYFVTRPTGPSGSPKGHVVRIYGNFDDTHLTYPGANPGGPSTISAGQFVDLGVVDQDFEIVGDKEFIVASFQVGAGPISGQKMGDPSQTFPTTVEQYRLKYVFLAPDDYELSFVDVIMPMTATLSIDDMPVNVTPTLISSGFGLARVPLSNTGGGKHVLTSTEPAGIQVLGYGDYTSYQYPGGLNLGRIAQAPIQ